MFLSGNVHGHFYGNILTIELPSVNVLHIYFFRKAREDEAAATKRLNDMIANYGDVIPRRDFESLQKLHNVSRHLLGLGR